MILGFKTEINGKPTFFVEKILNSFYKIILDSKFKPKIHTIREDKNNRWKAGVMIDFYTGVGTKKMKQFIYRVPVVSTQEIIINIFMGDCHILVNNMKLSKKECEQLAINDGFNNLKDFTDFFSNYQYSFNFKGVIIHWTDKKY